MIIKIMNKSNKGLFVFNIKFLCVFPFRKSPYDQY